MQNTFPDFTTSSASDTDGVIAVLSRAVVNEGTRLICAFFGLDIIKRPVLTVSPLRFLFPSTNTVPFQQHETFQRSMHTSRSRERFNTGNF